MQDKARDTRNAADDDKREAKEKAGEQNRKPVVDAVGEHNLEPAVQGFDPLQQVPGAVRVLDVGCVDDHAQQQSLRVNRDMALAPLHSLCGIITAWPPFSVVLTL